VELLPGGEPKANVGSEVGHEHLSLAVDDKQDSVEELSGPEVVSDGALGVGVDDSWQVWATVPDGNRTPFGHTMPEWPQGRA